MTKRLSAKKEYRKVIKGHESLTTTMRREYLPFALLTVLLLGSTFRQPMKADEVGSGVFGGAATGALIGGLAGGGRGAGYGALAGGLIGGLAGSAAKSERREDDPYYRLDKEERKLRRLQDRYDRTSNPRKQETLGRQIQTQTARVNDLRARLGGRY